MENLESSSPQDPHKYFKNLIHAFKKEITGSIDLEAMQEKMQMILNAAKEMHYTDSHKKSIFHKPETQKALEKLFTEFDRYFKTIQNNPSHAQDQDLLDALSQVEALLAENDIY